MKVATTILTILLLLPLALAQQGPPPASVELGAVASEEIRQAVSGVGTVEPWQRSVLSTEIAGLVDAYPLREGDHVVAGETVVCRLRATSLKIDLAEAKALLARARAEADTAVETAKATMEEQKALSDQARRELERAKDLFGNQVINRSELDRAEAEATAAKHRWERAEQTYRLAVEGVDAAQQALVAEVRRAEAQLARVEDQIAKATIVSPLTGRVVRRFVEVGSWVNPGSPVIEVATLDPVLVRVGISEKDIAPVKVGDPAVIRTDAYPDTEFEGKVRFIVPEAEPRSRTFPVLIEIPNADDRLLAGMFTRVQVRSGEPREAFTVPKDAVVNGPQGTVVVTLGPTKEIEMGGRKMPLPTAKFVSVKTGVSIDGRIEVAGEGLAPGMPVVTTGNERLMPGQPLIPPRPAPGGPGGGPGGGSNGKAPGGAGDGGGGGGR